MIRHIVIWKMRDASDPAAHTEQIRRGLEGLVGQIDGLLEAHVYVGTGSDGYTLMLDSLLENQQALDFYQDHPKHLEQKEIISAYTCGRFAFDCQVYL